MNGDVADAATRRELLFVDRPYPNHNGGEVMFGPDGDALHRARRRRRGGDPQQRAQNLGAAASARSCASIRRRAATRRTRSRPTIRSSARPARVPRSGCTGCATRGASRSTARPATCGSATSARTRGRRSTSPRPAPAPASTGAGTRARARTSSRAAAGRRARPDLRAVPRRRQLRGRSAATSTAARAIPALRGAYVFADYCAGELIGARAARRRARRRRRSSASRSSEVTSFGEDAAGELYVLSRSGQHLPHRPGVSVYARA